MVKAGDNATPASGTAAIASPTGYTSSPANLSARWAKLRADPALQRSAALRARLARRERKNRQRILRLQEFHRLRSMVPAIAQTPNVDKVRIIQPSTYTTRPICQHSLFLHNNRVLYWLDALYYLFQTTAMTYAVNAYILDMHTELLNYAPKSRWSSPYPLLSCW